MIRAAVFDFGETLLSEERAWGVWADFLEVPHQEIFAALGALIQARDPHLRVLDLVKPGTDFSGALAARDAAGLPRHEQLYDVYPDAPAALDRLRAAGLRVAAAGNQPEGAEEAFSTLMRPGELVATSAAWGVSKPDPAFFARVLEELALPAGEVAYIGDRLDNDVLPAADAGMFTIHLRRGPWGVIHATWPEATRADARVTTLTEVADLLLT